MRAISLRKLILTAMFAALSCVATLVIQIPSPLGGYFNLGDCIVLLGAFVLGPVWGAAAGGIGSMLADLILAYAIYAPATLVIKALMAAAAALIYRALYRLGHAFIGSIFGAVIGEIIMVAGYFVFELPMYGFAACVETALTTNLPQAAVGLTAAVALFTLLNKTRLTNKMQGGIVHAK